MAGRAKALKRRDGVSAPEPVGMPPLLLVSITDGSGGTEGMSGVWLRILDVGLRNAEAGVGVPGPARDFLANTEVAVPPMLGLAVRRGRGVRPVALDLEEALLARLFASKEFVDSLGENALPLRFSFSGSSSVLLFSNGKRDVATRRSRS